MQLAAFITLLLAAGPSGLIAYVSDDGDTQTVRVVDTISGADIKAGPGNHDGPPRWSPDGAWLAFASELNGGRGISVVRPDGSEGRYLSHQHSINADPRWSPDGTLLAYVSGSGLEQTISVYNLAADKETTWGGGKKGLMSPAWFSRPTFLQAMLSNEDLEYNLPLSLTNEPYLAAVGLVDTEDGQSTELVVVTQEHTLPFPPWAQSSKDGDYTEWAVAVAPKDRAIVFESNDGGDRELFLAIKQRVFDISNHHAADWNPVWAPDGHWIAFESFRKGPRGIYRVHRDSSRIVTVIADRVVEYHSPSWSPDEKWIACVKHGLGIDELVMVNIKSKESTSLITTGQPLHLAWRPKP